VTRDADGGSSGVATIVPIEADCPRSSAGLPDVLSRLGLSLALPGDSNGTSPRGPAPDKLKRPRARGGRREPMAIRILILERHALFGEAIRSALLDAKMDVLDVIPTGRNAIAFLEHDQPDVLLIGLDLADTRANLMKRRPRKSDGLRSGAGSSHVGPTRT
jgi:hypothetical protein